MTVKTIFLYSNGNSVAFDETGQQMGSVISWFPVYLHYLETLGIDPTRVELIETVVNGEVKTLKPFKTSEGYSIARARKLPTLVTPCRTQYYFIFTLTRRVISAINSFHVASNSLHNRSYAICPRSVK